MLTIKKFDKLLDSRFIIHSIRHLVTNHNEFVLNDFMASEPKFKFWKVALKYLLINYKEKDSMEIYKTWKGRFVVQTTGPKFLSRALKKIMPKYKPRHVTYTKWRNDNWRDVNRNDFYVEDYKAGSWLNDTNPNLKTHKTFKKTESELLNEI